MKKNSAEEMLSKGWCEDCEGDPRRCLKEKRCLGEIKKSEKKFVKSVYKDKKL